MNCLKSGVSRKMFNVYRKIQIICLTMVNKEVEESFLNKEIEELFFNESPFWKIPDFFLNGDNLFVHFCLFY